MALFILYLFVFFFVFIYQVYYEVYAIRSTIDEPGETYVSKVGLFIDGSHFLGVGGGRDVRGELRDQNGSAPCHRTGQFGELAETFCCPNSF